MISLIRHARRFVLAAALAAVAACAGGGSDGPTSLATAIGDDLPPGVRNALAANGPIERLRWEGQARTVYPREIHGVLVNPGMGIQTFQRYNGQTINPGTAWSEFGPTQRVPAAATQPDYPEASVAYCRWNWRDLEPEEGHYRWDIIDLALSEARAHGQTLMIRLMPHVGGDNRPDWFKKIAAPGRADLSVPPARLTRPRGDQPDYDDRQYLKHWGALVAAAGARYDGHPDLEAVDISSIGSCGEGGCRFMPTWENQKTLADIYLRAFKRTPLLVNIDAAEAVPYALERGAGWRLDCWGDMRSAPGTQETWGHMLDVYPQQIIRLGMTDAWKTRPVSLETCWVPLTWKQEGRDVDYILAQALRWHASTINIKSSGIPPEWKGKFDEFQKKLGYRFILRRLSYPKTAAPGQPMALSMLWLNDGVSPVYRPYTLAVQLKSADAQVLLPVPVDVRKWLPEIGRAHV
jgi:hypothetical protein